MKTCTRCGFKTVLEGARFCKKCGTKLSEAVESVTPDAYASGVGSRIDTAVPIRMTELNASGRRRHGRGVVGSLLILAGLAVYLWVRGHSPHMDLGEAMIALGNDSNAYYFKEPVYSFFVLVAAFLVLLGVGSLLRQPREQ